MLSCYILIASEGMPIQQMKIKKRGQNVFFCVVKSWVDRFSAAEAENPVMN